MAETYRQSVVADRKVQSLSIARYMAPLRRIDDWAAQSAERNVNLLPVPDQRRKNGGCTERELTQW